MTTLAPKLPWSHAYAGGFPRMGGQSLVSDGDAQDYLDRVKAADGGVGVEVGVAQAIDAFVRGCKADSAGYAGDPTRTNWDALKACCIMAGARTISGALVPLKGTAPTAQGGWTSNEYSRGGTTPGLKGNGSTLYLDTNRASNADGQDDRHVAAYTSSSATITSDFVGVVDNIVSPPAGTAVRLYAGQGFQPYVSSANIFSPKTPAVFTGFVGASRQEQSQFYYRHNATSATWVNNSSAAPNVTSHYVFATRLASTSTPNLLTDARLSFYSIGSSLDLAALDARTSHLMNSIRFTLLTGLSPAGYDPATLAYLLAAYTAGGSLS